MANEKQQQPAQLAASIIPEFHSASDDWNVYREILEEFYRANGITGAARVPVLLSVIGKTTYRTVRGLCHPRSPKEMEYDELCRVMARQFVPEIAIFRLRSRFYRAEQRRCGESVKQWYARLKALSVECQFEEQQLESLLLDRFVIGLAPGPVQNRLCEEVPGSLTLERAVDIAASVEAAADDAEEMVQEFAELGLGEGGEGDRQCHRRGRRRHHGRHAGRFGFAGHEAMGPWGPFAAGWHHRHGRHHHRHRHHHQPYGPAPPSPAPWHSEADEMQPHRYHRHHRHPVPGVPHWGPPGAGFFMPGGFGRPCHRERPSRGYGPGMMCPGSSYERRLAKKWRKLHYRMRRSSSTSSSSSSGSSSSSSSSSGSSSSSSSASGSASETEPQTTTMDKKCRKRDKSEVAAAAAAAERKHRHHGKHHHHHHGGHGRHEHGHGRRRGHGHGHGHHGHHGHGFDAGSRRHQHRNRRQQPPVAEETQPINNEPTLTEPELIE
uniref:Putative vitellogenin-2 n=1 Tax=Anopheles braziliensis TaxID=58242 RepID=A0A2M3Z0N2_9DIPT